MVGDRWWVLKLSLEGENKSEGDLTIKIVILRINFTLTLKKNYYG